MRENVRREENSYRVCLVGGVEKWEDRKYFNFSHFCLVGSEKSGGMEKVSLYKFTNIPLLKNDAQLKKKWQKIEKKKSPKFIKK